MSKTGQLIIFDAGNSPVQVRLEGESIWLTQRQIAEVFATTPENVLMHLKNTFRDGELEEAATTKDFLAVQTESRTTPSPMATSAAGRFGSWIFWRAMAARNKDVMIRLIENMLAPNPSGGR